MQCHTGAILQFLTRLVLFINRQHAISVGFISQHSYPLCSLNHSLSQEPTSRKKIIQSNKLMDTCWIYMCPGRTADILPWAAFHLRLWTDWIVFTHKAKWLIHNRECSSSKVCGCSRISITAAAWMPAAAVSVEWGVRCGRPFREWWRHCHLGLNNTDWFVYGSDTTYLLWNKTLNKTLTTKHSCHFKEIFDLFLHKMHLVSSGVLALVHLP